MMGRKRLLRLLVQLACFTAASVLLWPVAPWKGAARFVAQTSPFTAICSSVALRAIGIGTGIGWAFGIVALFRRRWFCRYVCPTGLLVEGASQIGFRKVSWWNRCPPLGQYITVLTIAGATVGYPLLLWTDPLAIFGSSLAIRVAGGVMSGVLAGVLLSVLILLSLTSGSIWCARICPLGAIQDLLSSAKSRFEDAMKKRLKPSAPVPGRRGSRMTVSRRTVLLAATGMGFGLWAKMLGAARGEDAPLRPPGAAVEEQFAGFCIRCGNCVRVCPSKIIHPDTGQAGLAGLLAPIIRYENKYCLEDCAVCTQVCPSGALQKLDLKQKRQYVIGEALVDGSICLLTRGEKDCDVCVRSCPYDAVRIHWDEERYVAYPTIDVGKCNGCGACEVVCPTAEIKAIRVWKSAP